MRSSRSKLQANRAPDAQNSMNRRVRWHLGALTSVVAILASLTSLDAQALALGRVTVQSALGEPLRAEIDIAEITSDEASSLKAGVASAAAFKAAGLEYTSAVVGVQVTLQKRPDGRSYLRLSSSRPVAEPFVDLVLEASWSSGRIVRDYTMLFDPPTLRSGSALGVAPVTAPVLPRQSVPADIPPARGTAVIPYYPTSPPPARAATVVPTPAPTRAARQESRAKALASSPAGEKQVAVKSGDTAGKIAAQNKPASVSLDQMLVALLRSNPDAFIGGNINRLKAGSVLEIPGANDAAAISPAEASRTIVAQSTDFNDFRRKLAEGVPTTQAGSASRQAAGKVQAKVEDRAAPAAVPDKLTLSKGAVQGKAAAEEKIAKDRQAKDASTRVAELTKNIADLNKLTASPATSGAAPAATASSAKSPGVAITGSSLTPPAATASSSAPLIAASAAKLAASGATSVVTAAPGVTPTSTTVATLSPTVATITASVTSTVSNSASLTSAPSTVAAAKPAASAAASSAVAKKPAVAPPPPPPEPSLIDELTDNPFVLAGVGALLVLLAAFGFYRYKRKRNDAAQVDSSFLESRLQPDSFFGASGGQRIDTSEGGATGSSLVYSPSQLDAAGDVDPVAEADVYLAYGRDLQAEEILKEAMRTSPTRVAIHAKLLEIYAKRRDAKAFEVVAAEAFNLTHGQGPEWAYIGELGRDLDPGNPLYQPGGQPHAAIKASQDNTQYEATAAFDSSSTIPQTLTAHPEVAAAPMDFDLDLDFSSGDEPAVATPVAAAPVADSPALAYESEPTVAMQLPPDPIFDGLEMDFPLDNTAAIKPTPEAPVAQVTAPPPPVAPPAPVVAAHDSGMLEFDLGSLSLDLGGPPTESPSLTALDASPLSASEDPLETKFALAEEFHILGDTDGARSLAEEVAAQAKGPLKAKAQSFLASLS